MTKYGFLEELATAVTDDKPINMDRFASHAHMNHHVCGCGSVKNVIDIACTEVAKITSSDDCDAWDALVLGVMVQVLANVKLARTLASASDEGIEIKADSANMDFLMRSMLRRSQAINEMACAILNENDQYVTEQINGRIRDAYNASLKQ